MNILLYLFTLIVLFTIVGCSESDKLPPELKKEFSESVSFSVENPSDFSRDDASVFLQISDFRTKQPNFNDQAFLIWSADKEVPSQAVDSDGDRKMDEIILNISIAGNEKKDLTVRYAKDGEKSRAYKKRTQAELSHKFDGEFVDRKYIGGNFKNVSYLKLPPDHIDHSGYIRYEGPGWESDKVGYRFYLDWRNAIDIFGKKVGYMVLQKVGQDGYDSYHNPADWGMDILKVGESLGVGSIAMWEDGKANRVAVTENVDCGIAANGPVYSQIRTRYFGWEVGSKKYDLVSDLSITAGSRITKNLLHVEGGAINLCSGLAKYDGTDYFQSDMDKGGWAYIALYGKQSLAEDNLGTAVLFDTKQLAEINEDELNHVVVLKPHENKVTYYFCAAWEQEPAGIKSKQGFMDYLDQTIKELNVPLMVTY
jgi:hypothetical protein